MRKPSGNLGGSSGPVAVLYVITDLGRNASAHVERRDPL